MLFSFCGREDTQIPVSLYTMLSESSVIKFMCSFLNVAEAFSAGGAGENLMQSFGGGQVRSIFVTKFCRGEVILDNCLIVRDVESRGSPITDLKSAFGSGLEI